MSVLSIRGVISPLGVENMLGDGVALTWDGRADSVPSVLQPAHAEPRITLRSEVPKERCILREEVSTTRILIPLFYCYGYTMQVSQSQLSISRSADINEASDWDFELFVPEKQVFPGRFGSILQYCTLSSADVG